MTPGFGYGYGYGLGVPKAPAWTPLALPSSLLFAWYRPEDIENPNRLLHTNDFENAVWIKGGAITVDSGYSDPDGGSTAFLIGTGSTGQTVLQDSPGFQASEDDVNAVWIKQGPGHNGTSRARIRINDGVGQTDLNFIPSASWKREEITRTLDAGATRARWVLYPDYQTGTESILVWHPQLERGTSPTTYRENLGVAYGIVSSWPDASPNGRDVVQATGSQQMLVQADVLDGYAGAYNDGIDDILIGAGFAMTQPCNCYYVMSETTTASYGIFFGSGTLMYLNSATSTLIRAGTNLTLSARTAGEHPRLFRGYFNGGISKAEMWNHDGSGSYVFAAGNAGLDNPSDTRVSGHAGGRPEMWTHEALLCDATLPAGPIALIENYFKTKYPSLLMP